MRRFLGRVVLGVVVAGSFLAAGQAVAAPARTRDAPPLIWQVLGDLLRPVFGTSEGDGSPQADPDGLTAPPPGGGAESGSGDGSGSGNADGSPGMDPDG